MKSEKATVALAAVTVQNPGPSAETKASAALARAEQIVIATDADYSNAANDLKDIKAKSAEIEAQRRELKRPIDEAAAKVQAFFRGPLDFLTRAESILKRKLLAYQQEQERKRREEQARLEEQARKERERIAAQAAKAAAAGKAEKAQALEERAATVVAPIIQRDPPKVTGLSTRENWRAECIDILALARAVAEGRAPVAYLQANDKVLGQQARSLKAQFVCDGVRVWKEDSLASGAA